MRQFLLSAFILFTSISLQAQRIEKNIFGELEYRSSDWEYKAYLKKNIFDDLIFSDNRENKITFTKKYVDREFGSMPEDLEHQSGFFINLIRQYRRERDYIATFSVDIFDKIVIKDNRGSSIEIGTDIFGNPTYEEERGGERISIERDLLGTLIYKSNRGNATLKQDIFNKWLYEDSSGNKFEFSQRAWNSLIRQYGDEEEIFIYLVNRFL